MMMRPAARDEGLQFVVFRSGNLPAAMLTDSGRIRQCLFNLIGNAIKFTSKGHVHLKVSVEERAIGFFVRFDVEDTGVGIAADKHKSIFKPFEQVDGSGTRKHGGTGLGLAITRQLAQLLGGDLSMTSEVGKGSVFSLVIPAGVVVEPPSLSVKDEEVRGIGSGLGAADDLRFSGKILVAEDSKGNQILIEEILRRHGLEVVVVGNGEEAVGKTLGGYFDLILMDIRMPGLNGLEATKKLREEGITTPVVALTAYAMAGDREKCLEAGCDDYLTKPINQDEFKNILSKYVSAESVSA
jgi:CheY-like chemotaxis protein